MFSENIYINTNFKNKYDSSDIDTDFRPDPPKKSKSQKSCHKFSKVLFTSLIIYFLLLTILFSSALIILFKKYSQLLEEKTIMKELNYTELECTKWDSLLEDKVWSCCPKDWKPFDSNCYFPSTDSVESWMESEEKCSGIGAHLVVIHSQEEQDFITDTLNPRAHYYVGLSDTEGHGKWQWVDQTPFNQNATSWHADEPSGNKGFCVVLSYHPNLKGWGWSVAPCDGYHRLVCKMRQLYV